MPLKGSLHGMDRSTVKLHGLHHDVHKEELLAFLNSIRMPAEAARIVIDDETGTMGAGQEPVRVDC